MSKNKALEEFKQIPGVGDACAQDLWNIGIRSMADLKLVNPETLYEKLCQYQGQKVDRCMLYVFRCAVYYASHDHHDSNLLKWWSWKDSE